MTTSPFDDYRPPEVPRRRRRPDGDGEQRRRRPDPHSMVPDVTIEHADVENPGFASYYGRPVIKPLPWKHEIPGYLFVGGVTGGTGLIGCWAHTVGYTALRRRSRWIAMVGTGISGALLVADLGHPERFLNMMRTVKLTSPMSIGSWILSGFGTFAAIATAAEVVEQLGWVGETGVIRDLHVLISALGSAGSAAFAAPLVSYTAVLLSDTAAPTWHEAYRELPWVFVFSANAAAAGLAMLTSPKDETGPTRALAVFAAGVETVAFLRMQKNLGPLLAEPLHHGHAGKLINASKILTVGGAVGVLLFGRSRVGAALSGLALLAGSACTRFGVFEAGIHSAKDPKYTIVHQRRRVAERNARGDGSKDITTAR